MRCHIVDAPANQTHPVCRVIHLLAPSLDALVYIRTRRCRYGPFSSIERLRPQVSEMEEQTEKRMRLTDTTTPSPLVTAYSLADVDLDLF